LVTAFFENFENRVGLIRRCYNEKKEFNEKVIK